MLFGWAAIAWAAAPARLTTLRAVAALTNEQAAQHLPVSFQGTITYFRSYDGLLFVQDGDAAIYVHSAAGLKLVLNDDEPSITISDPSGNMVTLNEAGITVSKAAMQIVVGDASVTVNDGALVVE